MGTEMCRVGHQQTEHLAQLAGIERHYHLLRRRIEERLDALILRRLERVADVTYELDDVTLFLLKMYLLLNDRFLILHHLHVHLVHPLLLLCLTAQRLRLHVTVLTANEVLAPPPDERQEDKQVDDVGYPRAVERRTNGDFELTLNVTHRTVVIEHAHTQRVGTCRQRHVSNVGVHLLRAHPLLVEAHQLIDEARAVMNLTAAARQLNGKLVLAVPQHQLTADVKCLVQYHTAVELTRGFHLTVKDLQTTEQGRFLDTSCTHLLRIDDVKTTLSAYEHDAVGRIANGALVIGSVLQAVAVVEAADDKRPPSIVLLLQDDVAHTVVSNEPHGMATVLDKAIDRRAYQTRLHVKQIDMVGLGVPDGGTRRGALPDESAAVLHTADRHLGNLHTVLIVGDVAVIDLEALGVDERIVVRVGRHEPALGRWRDGRDIVAGNGRIIHVNITHATGIGVKTLDTSTQRTNPDIAVARLIDRPYVVAGQSRRVARSTVVSHMTVLNAYETALVGAEPRRAVTGSQRSHHDVGADA